MMAPWVGWGQEVWDGTIAEKFAGGSGSEFDPYQISNGAELAYLAKLVNEDEEATKGKYYILTDDIILNEGNCESWKENEAKNEWTPIGYYVNPKSPGNGFEGFFDGNNKTISGIYIKSEGEEAKAEVEGISLGLFGNVVGFSNQQRTIKNLKVTNSYIKGTGNSSNVYIGGIVGFSREGRYTISNCSFDGFIEATYKNREGSACVSGIFGGVALAKDCIIESCINEADLDVSLGEGYSANISGIGFVNNILYSVNKGDISVSAQSSGILSISGVGSILYSPQILNQIASCYNTGNITLSGSGSTNSVVGVGGIQGIALANSDDGVNIDIQYCYNMGDIDTSKFNVDVASDCAVGAILGQAYEILSYKFAKKDFTNNYYLEGNNIKAIGTEESDATDQYESKSPDAFEKGEVACLLRDGGYGQNLDNSGSTPFLTNAEEDKVYSLTLKDSEDDSEPQVIYANSGESIELMDDTEFGNITEGSSLVGKTDEGKAMSLGQNLESLDRDLVLTLEETTVTYYAVEVQETDGVTVVRDANFAKEGETVKITTEIAEDYALTKDNLKVTTNTNELVTVTSVAGKENTYTFTMPASKVTVEALATSTLKPYTISLRIKYRDYDEKAKIEASQTTANAGEEITLTITLPHDQLPHKIVSFETEGINPSDLENTNDKTGYYLIGEDVFTYKFTMPAKNVSIDAFADRCVGLDIETDGNGWLEMVTRTAHETDEVVSIRSSVENNKNTFYGYGSEGELVTLRIHPNPGYEVDEISLHNYYYEHDDVEDIWDFRDEWKVIVEVTGEGNNYTFNIPSGQWKFSAVYGTITFKEAEEEEPSTDIDKRYQLFLADRDFYLNDKYDAEGLVLFSRHDKRYAEVGGSFTVYYEKDGEVNAGDYRIFWSKSANGEYKEVKLDEVSGYYQIRNVQSDVYVKIYGRDGFPVSNETIEATEARAYAQANKIIVVTHEPMDVQIVSMAGAVVGNAKVAGQQEFGNLAEGVYIVRLGETVVKLQVRN